jgi:hypothetical protein
LKDREQEKAPDVPGLLVGENEECRLEGPEQLSRQSNVIIRQSADRDRDGNNTPPAGAGWKPAGETRPRRYQRGRRDRSDRSDSAVRRVQMFEIRGQRH